MHSQQVVLLTLEIRAVLLSQGGSAHTPGIVILVHFSYLVTSLKLSQKGTGRCCFGCYYQAPGVKGHATQVPCWSDWRASALVPLSLKKCPEAGFTVGWRVSASRSIWGMCGFISPRE